MEVTIYISFFGTGEEKEAVLLACSHFSRIVMDCLLTISSGRIYGGKVIFCCGHLYVCHDGRILHLDVVFV